MSDVVAKTLNATPADSFGMPRHGTRQHGRLLHRTSTSIASAEA